MATTTSSGKGFAAVQSKITTPAPQAAPQAPAKPNGKQRRQAKQAAAQATAQTATTAPAPTTPAPQPSNGPTLAPAGGGKYGVSRAKDINNSAHKNAVLAALLALQATTPVSGVTSKVLGNRSGVGPRWARHYCYHAKTTGLTQVYKNASGPGYVFCLTPAGVAWLAKQGQQSAAAAS